MNEIKCGILYKGPKSTPDRLFLKTVQEFLLGMTPQISIELLAYDLNIFLKN